jgi:hypothetical protein
MTVRIATFPQLCASASASVTGVGRVGQRAPSRNNAVTIVWTWSLSALP